MVDEETRKPLQIVEYPQINNDMVSSASFRTDAYKLVFDDLTKCNMFKGIYDAKHGNADYMYGILTIMENIALNVSEDCYEKFTAEFTKNMTESENKANHKEDEENNMVTKEQYLEAICKAAHVDDIGDVSDGYHTFNQLYYQRMMLFATIVKQNRDKSWKSLRHEDGELCFGGGWFIVGIDTPEGGYTYHYEDKYFDLFDCETLDHGKHWDGHTEKDVTRLLSLQQESKRIHVSEKLPEMANEEIIEQLENAIELIKQDGKDWLDDRDFPITNSLLRLLETCIKSLTALDKIRDEIAAIEINGQVDEHTLFMKTGEQVKQMVLDIIDKYKIESEE